MQNFLLRNAGTRIKIAHSSWSRKTSTIRHWKGTKEKNTDRQQKRYSNWVVDPDNRASNNQKNHMKLEIHSPHKIKKKTVVFSPSSYKVYVQDSIERDLLMTHQTQKNGPLGDDACTAPRKKKKVCSFPTKPIPQHVIKGDLQKFRKIDNDFPKI